MFGRLFGGARFLDADLEDWQLETWDWLMRHLGGVAALKAQPLAMPSREFFPPFEGAGHARAEHALECAKRVMGMPAWTCDLVAVDRRPANQKVGEFLVLQGGSGALGTFSAPEGRVTISYAADLVDRPAQLVATLAHELAHYLLASIPEPPPGGWETHELATELAVAYAGMGIIAANAAFSFEQHGDAFSQGWRSSRSGYFSERSWAFAIAVFAALSDRAGAAEPHLKPTIAQMVRSAGRYLEKHPARLAELRRIP